MTFFCLSNVESRAQVSSRKFFHFCDQHEESAPILVILSRVCLAAVAVCCEDIISFLDIVLKV